MPRPRVAKAWQADSLSPGKAMHCLRHAIPNMAKAKLTKCQNKGWPRHYMPIVFHRARQCIAHGIPKQGVFKARQANCLSPGMAMHCSRHYKTNGGQGIAHGKPK
ncbi:hypothetical protein RHGRI_001439 [Rhododendron griersonianum]|uniref:Uncharacterized protein n=1 Tax=Rhododendron griersonianum TaxID=479676 RepID=A0AAV6LKQ6_9ERIC|nr:hypothetical protein RHGRI_001439 [Rhododendron griersonianum]